MQIQIRACETCKAEYRQDTDKEKYDAFGTFRIQFEGMHSDRRYDVSKGYLHICQPCMERIGVFKRLQDPTQPASKTSADQLYEIIAEIVREATP